MKKIILLVFAFPFSVHAAEPATTCPTGYMSVNEGAVIIVNESTCPTDYTSTGTVQSCLLASPAGVCMMFAPENTPYSDNTGEYIFTQACQLS